MRKIHTYNLRQRLMAWIGVIIIIAFICLLFSGCSKPLFQTKFPVQLIEPVQIAEPTPKAPQVNSGEFTIFQTQNNGHCGVTYITAWYLENNILWYTPKDQIKYMPMCFGPNIYIEIGFVPEAEWQNYGRFDLYFD